METKKQKTKVQKIAALTQLPFLLYQRGLPTNTFLLRNLKIFKRKIQKATMFIC